MRHLLLLSLALLVLTHAGVAHATADFVYHERTTNPIANGTPTCPATIQYIDGTTPTPGDGHTVRFKVQYKDYTNQVHVYYTIDGSNPGGSKGENPVGTTKIIDGAYNCTFVKDGSQIVDVATGVIPAWPVGTIVKYIIGAHHTGGGNEVFANTWNCYNSSCATVFTYTVQCMGDQHCTAGNSTPACVIDGSTSSCEQCSPTNVTFCGPGHFCDATHACADCETNCTACSDASTCTTCAAGYGVLDGNCYNPCPVGTFLSPAGACEACEEHCDHCSDATTCTTCNGSYVLLDGNCISSCPIGMYLDPTGHCANCETNCALCADASTCTACNDPYVLFAGNCVASCPDHYHSINRICIDDNECAGEGSGSDCDPHAICANTDGSFTCTCRESEGWVGDGRVCEAHCGDGIRAGTEECDDGNAVDTDKCTTLCKNAVCGDGFIRAGVETCEPPNEGACDESCRLACEGDADCIDTDACTVNEKCTGGRCETTVVDVDDNEPCTLDGCFSDRGIVHDPAADGRECSTGVQTTVREICITGVCGASKCGDGYRDGMTGEQCDDGNLVDGDTCTSMCTAPSCGNGIVDVGEECDGSADCHECRRVRAIVERDCNSSGAGPLAALLIVLVGVVTRIARRSRSAAPRA